MTLPLELGAIQDSDVRRAFEQIAQAWPTTDPWHLVGAANQPAFQNAWVNFGGGLSVVAFYRAGDRVYLKGQAQSGTAGASIFTLPAGYVPLERLDPPITANGAASALTILASGAVIPVAGAGNVRVSLDGVEFRIL